RALRCSPPAALLGVLTLAAYPVGFALAFTFMTDVPYVVLALASLCASIAGLQRKRLAPIAVGVVLAVGAFLVRPIAIALTAGLTLILMAAALVASQLAPTAVSALKTGHIMSVDELGAARPLLLGDFPPWSRRLWLIVPATALGLTSCAWLATGVLRALRP